MKNKQQYISLLLGALAAVLTFASAVNGQQSTSQPELSEGYILSQSRPVGVYIHKSMVKIPETNVKAELRKHPNKNALNLVVVDNPHRADLLLEVEYPIPLLFEYSFKLKHQRTSVVIAAGKVIAWDGLRAAPAIAKKLSRQLVKIKKSYQPPAQQPKTSKNAGKNTSR